MQNLGWMIIEAVLASAAFYLPLLLLWIILGPDWAAVFLLPLTLGLPLLLSYVCQRFRRLAGTGSASTAYAMILGTWALGPVWLGFFRSDKALPAFHEVLEFPIYTFIESTYAGLLGALLLTTVLLLVCAMGRGPFHSVALKEPEPSPR